jgi:DNA modification methylase
VAVRIIAGDVREVLPTLESGSVQCCVTSPPYFGLRDYNVAGQIGLEPTPDEYVAEMVAVFREVRRVLRADGTFWLNLGDSYSAGGAGPGSGKQITNAGANVKARKAPPGYKPKDLLGIPWMVAFALRADGWYLRRDIIWAKPNPMPESVRDRPTSAHEYVFLLTKSRSYFYDADAIREPASEAMLQQVADGYGGSDTKDYAASGAQSASGTKSRIIAKARARIDKQRGHGRRHAGFNDRWDNLTGAEQMAIGSNARSVWSISPAPFREAHFATMPPDLAERCILAGSRIGDTVLDPFGGAGTTGLVADRLKRDAVLIELNPEYAAMAAQRIQRDGGLFAEVAA